MAGLKNEKIKRKNNRKTRTAPSPVSSSSSGESPSSSPGPSSVNGDKSHDASNPPAIANNLATASNAGEPAGAEPGAKSGAGTSSPAQAFEAFYLQQTTREFAQDLDQLRLARDFNAQSVPLLVAALKQGVVCFSVEERERIGRSVRGDA